LGTGSHFLDSLELAKEKYPCKIYSFILMSNHVHLLVEPIGEEQNLAHFNKYYSTIAELELYGRVDIKAVLFLRTGIY
jgi:hypothetical protein